MNSVQMLQVAAKYDGQRLDNYLLRVLKGVPKSRLYRGLRKGEIRVNRGRAKPDYRLQTGDTIRIPPLRVSQNTSSSTPPLTLQERLQAAIIHEDHEVLALNKPAGLAVHGGSGLSYGVIETLRTLRPRAEFLELAHRLDRATSGCLLLAKTPAALRNLQMAFKTEQIDKRYLALVRGDWQLGRHEVTLPLRKNSLRSGERRVIVSADGKPARSHFELIDRSRYASLLQVRIRTGRTHQIRVHASHIEHPIAGDDKYGDAIFNRALAQRGLRRLFLHAHSLNVSLGGRELALSSPLEPALHDILNQLRIGY